MDIEDFFAEVRKAQIAHPNWRAGQTLFNVLYELRPDISEQIRATWVDPFYCERDTDDKYTNAVIVIRNNWDNSILDTAPSNN